MRKLTLIILQVLLLLPVYGQRAGIFASSGSSIAAQNLIKYSEQIDNAIWHKSASTTVTADQDGTMDLLTTTSTTHNTYYENSLDYADVVEGHTYYWSFDVKRGTMTDLKWCVYDRTNIADIIAPTSYYSQTSSSIQRVHCQFVVPAGCSKVAVYFIRDSEVAGTVYIGRAQLHENLNAPYVTTTTTIVP